jgi:hypothetical protein
MHAALRGYGTRANSIIDVVVGAVVAVMMTIPSHGGAPRHEHWDSIEKTPGRIVAAGPAHYYDAGHVRSRYGETDGDADASLRHDRRSPERERHSSCQEYTFHGSPPAGAAWKGRARGDAAIATATAKAT